MFHSKTINNTKIYKNERISLIGSNGKLSKDYDNKNKLPFIFGKPNIQEFLQFKKVIDHSKFRYEHIKNFYFFPSMRWDLEFKDNVILKLPKNNTKESLDHIFEFLNNKSLNDKKIIDARIQNQIILND